MNLPRLLNGSLNEVTRLHPIKLSISEKAVPLSTAQMQLLPSETVPERSYVELFTVNGSAGIYRAKTPEIGYGNITNTVNLEHAICEVGDWLINAEIAQTQKTLAQALTQVFGYYRGSKWQLGTVSATGNVIISAKYVNVLSTMNSLIAQVPGAMMTFNFSTSPWTVNVAAKETSGSAEGRLSRNVQTASLKKDISKLCTRVYVEGLGTNGAIGYQDADTASTYGIVENYLSGTGYTQAQAQTVASQYLAQHKNPRYSVDISLLDLSSITGETLDRIRIGKKFRLVIPEENVTVEENIISINWSDVINAPNVASITLSQEEENLIQFLSESANDTQDAIDDVYGYADGISQYCEDTYVAKVTGISTIDDILREAFDDAEAAATSAASGCIAKTATYQTAEAIVQSAVAISETSAGVNYIAKTANYQTADAVVTEAVRVSGVNAAAAYIAKTGDYATVQSILDKSLTDAQAAATTAASGCIAKTQTYQTADAIVSTAVATAATAAGNTYIAKTTSYQTADAIVQSATSYTDTKAAQISGDVTTLSGQVTTMNGTITTMSNQISLVVTQSQGSNVVNAASIVAAINSAGSSVVVSADKIDLHGHVSVGDLTEGFVSQEGVSLAVAGTLSATAGVYSSGNLYGNFLICNGATIGGTSIGGSATVTIDGQSYTFVTASPYVPN